jgi:uncharacterized protein YyaL (SSP411 family)
MQSMMARYPLGFAQWLQALSFALAHPAEVAIMGDPQAPDTQALLSVAFSGYQPFRVVASGAPRSQDPAVPLLGDRSLAEGRPAAYVCRDSTCQPPVTQPGQLRHLLETRGFEDLD